MPTTDSELPWEQGSLLPDGLVQPLQWVHPDEPATKAARGAVKSAKRRGDVTQPFPVPGPSKQGDRMMVITQSCDLVKPPEQLPQIEVARIFATENVRTIVQAQDFGSARYFRLNDRAEPTAEVLDYGHRALLDKGFLDAVTPDNRVLDALTAEDRKRLARWLGQRYSRPAIPDADHREITGPIREAWKQLSQDEPATAKLYNSEYAEWRYRRESDGSLTIYILAVGDSPDQTVALELSDFLTQAVQPSYPGPVSVADRQAVIWHVHQGRRADDRTDQHGVGKPRRGRR